MRSKVYTLTHTRGFNLIELLTVLTILAIFSVLSLSAASSSIAQLQAKAELNSLLAFLKNSRKQALLKQQHIFICPSTQNKCSRHWTNTLISFHDTNRNQQFDAAHENIILSYSFKSPYSHLFSAQLTNLSISALGMNYKLGSIDYCFIKGHMLFSSKISISMQGRFNAREATSGNCIQ